MRFFVLVVILFSSVVSHSQKLCANLAKAGTDKVICLGDTTIIGDKFQLGNTQYRWEPTTGLESPTEHSTKAFPDETTQYLFIVKDTDLGCTDTDTVVVTVNELDIDLGNDTSICGKINLTLSPGTIKFHSYIWSTGETTQTIKVTKVGNYWVEVTNKNGCKGRDTINVSAKAVLVQITGVVGFACNGQRVPISVNPTSGNILWSTGETSNTIQALLPGKYWVDVTVGGCTGTDTITLNGIDPPHVDLGNDTTICLGDSILLGYAGQTGNTVYQWYPPEISSDPNGYQSYVRPSESTEIVFSVTDTRIGCVGRDTITVWVQNPPLVDLGMDSVICDGDTIELDAFVPQRNTYSWSTGETTEQIKITKPGVYWVIVDDGMCTATDTIEFSSPTKCITDILETPGLHIKVYPNPVTDGFAIQVSNIESYQMDIFDVRGRLVYSQMLTGEINYLSSEKLSYPGIYTLQIIGGKKTIIGKLVKE